MKDIAPKLLKIIRDDFQKNFDKSEIIAQLYKKVRDGTATYEEANEFAIETGEILAAAYTNNISTNVLPDGKMYYNIAQRILEPTLENNYDLITDVTEQVQASLNKNAGIGIKAQVPAMNKDRIRGIVEKVSDSDSFADVEWLLKEPIINFSQSIVDDSIKTNAEFQSKLGMRPVIIRKIAGNCCDWCKALSGTYAYPEDVPNDLYRRHRYCRCTVIYNPKDGKRKVQNSHTKKWHSDSKSAIIESRKTIGLKGIPKESPQDKEKRIREENGLGLADKLSSHPKMLGAYTPKGLKQSLEKAGYEVKPLNRGKYKGVSFEDGGGFKVNFGGDGIIQYHPEKGSHHDGAYYKISTGEGGTRHYELDGTEKKDVK